MANENIINLELLTQYDAKIKEHISTEIDKEVSTLYTYKGSVELKSELPLDAEIGDVYNVVQEEGRNYAWTGTDWDSLGGTIDLSAYALKTELIGKKTAEGGEIFNNYNKNKATKSYAHAEGNDTQANATESHTEGYGTRTYGDHAHAEGSQTIAKGKDSHAEGQRTVSFAEGSHAEGASSKWLTYDNLVSGKDAAGMLSAWQTSKDFVAATGNYSHAEGRNTLSHGTGSHAEGGQTLANAVFAHAEGELTTVTGRAGHAEGKNTTTSAASAHAEGDGTTSSAPQAHAEGYQTEASGNNSHAEGAASKATKINAHAEGQSTLADGDNSHAEGASTQCTNRNAHAEGQGSIASGEHAHAEGDHSEATSNQTHAEGYYTKATSSAAHSEGRETLAQGVSSHAEGTFNKSLGGSSHTEGGHARTDDQQTRIGGGNIALGGAAHAEGMTTRAGDTFEDLGAHAEGGYTQALAPYAHAEGKGFVEDTSFAQLTIDSPEEEVLTINTGVLTSMDGIYVGRILTIENVDRPTRKYDVVIESFDSTTGAVSINMEFSPGQVYNAYRVYPTIAEGTASHAEGSYTKASGTAAHAEGQITKAIGDNSHAEGNRTAAHGTNAHAEGSLSVAKGNDSHAEGNTTLALNTAHAEGWGTKALGYMSHAEGKQTIVTGSISHAEGENTQPIAESGSCVCHSDSDRSYVTIHFDFSVREPHIGDVLKIENDIYTIISIDGHASSDAGVRLNKEFPYDIGVSKPCDRLNVNARGDVSHSEGRNTTAHGYYSHAEGQSSIMAPWTGNSGDDHDAIVADWSGRGVDDRYSLAWGVGTHVEGYNNLALLHRSHAEGQYNIARGVSSHAEGANNYARGHYAHTEGYLNETFGQSAHAGGQSSKAYGKAAFAHGLGLQAGFLPNGEATTESDVNNTDTVKTQAVLGTYNELNPDAVFIVGNGTNSSNRSNAIEVYSDRVCLNKSFEVLFASGEAAIKVGETILTEEFIKTLVSPDGLGALIERVAALEAKLDYKQL